MTIGARIREARRELGMSQEELARRAGMAVGTVSRYERGQLIPGGKSLQKLKLGLGVTVAWLLGEDSEPAAA